MDKEEFIEKIINRVRDESVEATVSLLSSPPGRKPAELLLELSNWYKGLSKPDQELVAKIIKYSIDTSIFGFLCILDEVRPIEDNFSAHLTLLYTKDGNEIKINDSDGDYLHEIFNSL